jgi:hypothetical protein
MVKFQNLDGLCLEASFEGTSVVVTMGRTKITRQNAFLSRAISLRLP